MLATSLPMSPISDFLGMSGFEPMSASTYLMHISRPTSLLHVRFSMAQRCQLYSWVVSKLHSNATADQIASEYIRITHCAIDSIQNWKTCTYLCEG
jgi:hypothetical protein